MKIICPKCGIIHDENFAPCKSSISLPAALATPREVAEERVLAAAAGAGPGRSFEGHTFQGHAQAERAPILMAAPTGAAESPGSSSAEPAWRLEVAERLESYRARRRNYRSRDGSEPAEDDSQRFLALASVNMTAHGDQGSHVEHTGNGHGMISSGGNGYGIKQAYGLPLVEFAPDAPAEESPETIEEQVRRRAALRVAARPRRADRFDITVVQPRFDFSVNEAPVLHPQDDERPVADLRERRLAGMIDATILGATCIGFFLAFRALGGEFSANRFGLAAVLASIYLVYAQYFVLFTIFTGVTPGMMLRRIEVLTLDGGAPSTNHLIWRSFGYLLSAAAVGLGFLWACWDDDHLTWQDRISQTYVTTAAEEAHEQRVANPLQS